ncbi:MAG: OmpA family protein [Kofleriaceae bacterium]
MAKRDDTGELIGPPGKPPKIRRFPWRLWLYALLVTAAAGAGGYFTWHFRGKAATEEKASKTCTDALEKAQANLTTATQDATSCKASLASQTSKTGELEQQLTQSSTNLSASKEELVALRAQKEAADKRMAAIEDIQKQFAKMIDTGALKVVSRRGSLVLSLPAEVLFPSGVAELSEEGKLKVLEVAFNLKRFPDRRFLVIGHTDNVPLKNSVYKDNWELSTARALTVTRILAQGGMNKKNLIPAGAGEYDELVANSSAASHARNRRIEIVLLPAINELPPLPAAIGDGGA